MPEYAYSLDQDDYYGRYPTRKDAMEAACEVIDESTTVWTGVCVPPPPPESYWQAWQWLEYVDGQDEYCGEWADGWVHQATPEQRAELEAEVRKVMAAWLDRHGLRPKFYNVEQVQKHNPE